jgi:hypothetical protein
MSSLKLPVFFGAAALALLSGCGPDYAYLEIGQLTNPPVSVSLTNQGFSVPVGIAVGITIEAIDDQGEPMDEDVPVELLSMNASVLGLSPGLDEGTYIVFGTGPGTTEISVSVDDERVDHIPVTVMLQQTK